MTTDRIKQILLTFWSSMIIIEIIIGFLQWAGYCPISHRIFIMTGTFGNPGPYACFVSLGIPLCLHVVMKLEANKFIINICTIALILSVFILPFLHSRTSFLAVFVGTVVSIFPYISYRFRISSLRLKIICISLSLALCIGVCLLLYTLKVESALSRLFIYRLVLPHLNWFGIGPENIPGFLSNLQEAYFSNHEISSKLFFSIDVPNKVMNEFLRISLAYGLFFGAIVIFWMVSCISFSVRMKEYGLTGSIFSLIIIFLFSYPLDYLEFIVVIVIMAVLCSQYLSHMLYRLSFIFMTVIIFSPIVIADINNLSEKNKWDKLRVLEGDYSALSLEVFRKSYEEGLRKPEFLFEYALKLRHNKMIDESQQVLEIGTSLSGDPAFFNEMAKNYMDKGDYHKAEECLIRSINKLPNRHYPHYLLALLYHLSDYSNPDLFIKHCQWVMNTQPKIPNKNIDNMRSHLKILLSGVTVKSIE